MADNGDKRSEEVCVWGGTLTEEINETIRERGRRGGREKYETNKELNERANHPSNFWNDNIFKYRNYCPESQLFDLLL